MVSPAAFLPHLRKAYGDLGAPRRDFVLRAIKEQPYAAVVRDLAALGPVVDDTEVNDDVCFTLYCGEAPLLVVKLSMAGPYAMVLSFGPDGLAARGRLLLPHDDPAADRVIGVLSRHGLQLPSADVLRMTVPVALVPGRSEVSLFAALFAPESDLLDRLEIHP